MADKRKKKYGMTPVDDARDKSPVIPAPKAMQSSLNNMAEISRNYAPAQQANQAGRAFADQAAQTRFAPIPDTVTPALMNRMQQVDQVNAGMGRIATPYNTDNGVSGITPGAAPMYQPNQAVPYNPTLNVEGNPVGAPLNWMTTHTAAANAGIGDVTSQSPITQEQVAERQAADPERQAYIQRQRDRAQRHQAIRSLLDQGKKNEAAQMIALATDGDLTASELAQMTARATGDYQPEQAPPPDPLWKQQADLKHKYAMEEQSAADRAAGARANIGAIAKLGSNVVDQIGEWGNNIGSFFANAPKNAADIRRTNALTDKTIQDIKYAMPKAVQVQVDSIQDAINHESASMANMFNDDAIAAVNKRIAALERQKNKLIKPYLPKTATEATSTTNLFGRIANSFREPQQPPAVAGDSMVVIQKGDEKFRIPRRRLAEAEKDGFKVVSQ